MPSASQAGVLHKRAFKTWPGLVVSQPWRTVTVGLSRAMAVRAEVSFQDDYSGRGRGFAALRRADRIAGMAVRMTSASSPSSIICAAFCGGSLP
jgi:hypothetical protein